MDGENVGKLVYLDNKIKIYASRYIQIAKNEKRNMNTIVEEFINKYEKK